jgi:hypothetical protein
MPPSTHPFQATIYKIWILRYVDVPEEIGRALEKESGKKKHIPVIAIANGRSARTTLTPAGGGRYRLQFNATLRRAARTDVGDLVGVELRIDRESRALPVPDDLRDALKAHPKARKAFERTGPGTPPIPSVSWQGQVASRAAEAYREATRNHARTRDFGPEKPPIAKVTSLDGRPEILLRRASKLLIAPRWCASLASSSVCVLDEEEACRDGWLGLQRRLFSSC